MDIKKFTCINCPFGCSLTAYVDNGNIKVEGNRCKRGEAYATNEIKDPKRIVTSTSKVSGGNRPVVSVKTAVEIPKRLIFDVMKEINKVTVIAPVNIGDIIIKNVLDTGCDIVATSNVGKK